MTAETEIRLIRPHVHKGVLYPEGTVLKLPRPKAEFLLKVGTGVLAGEVLAPDQKIALPTVREMQTITKRPRLGLGLGGGQRRKK